MTAMGNVWVYVELVGGKPSQLSLELLGKGRELADSKQVKLSAVILGTNLAEVAQELIGYGADEVICGTNVSLNAFEGKSSAEAIATLSKKYNPNVLLIGGSVNGRELGGRLSALLNIGLVADCIDCSYASEDDAITWIRPAYTGKLFVKILTTSRPQLATISDKIFRGNAFDGARQGSVSEETIAVSGGTGLTQTSFVAAAVEENNAPALSLENAEIIVSAGRGVGSEEGMQQVQNFAKEIGAAFGVSKPLVDAGWAPHDWQVGVTGKKVAPKIYIALGISGALQHLLGIKDAELVIAVNNDATAPIFERANYGIVGDLFEALPVLKEKLKK